MNNETGQPEILEAEWDFEQIGVLFDDLEQGAQIQHVQVRATSGDGPKDRTVTLREAHQMLKDGDAKAVQIRYRFGEQSWCDTLMVGSETVRIIRTADATS